MLYLNSLLIILSKSRFAFYIFGFICVNFYVSGLKYSTAIHRFESVFNKFFGATNMRKFFPDFLWIWNCFFKTILQLSNFLAISYFTCFFFSFKLLLFFFFLSYFDGNGFDLFIDLFSKLFVTVDLVL